MMSACVERMLTFAGFGDFLHDLDPEREWHEHLKHMLVFCSVHVKRNFAKRFPKHPARHIINQIWHEATLEALLKRMDSICTLYPELKSWINSKKQIGFWQDSRQNRQKYLITGGFMLENI